MATPSSRSKASASASAGRRPVEALRDVSMRVDAGDFVSIVGPSGCGKSTLFNLIAGIEPPTSGRIAVSGETDADERRLSAAATCFRRTCSSPGAACSTTPPWGSRSRRAAAATRRGERARELLPRFGLEGFEATTRRELSGGMRQRVALLRTLLLERPLLLLDEPFASLDALTRRELQAWLRETWRAGSEAALLVTHDVREAVYLSDRVYVMSPRPGQHRRGDRGAARRRRAGRAALAALEAQVLQRAAASTVRRRDRRRGRHPKLRRDARRLDGAGRCRRWCSSALSSRLGALCRVVGHQRRHAAGAVAHRSRRRGATATCCWTHSLVTLQETVVGLAVSIVLGSRAGAADRRVRAGAAGALPAARGLADHPGRGASRRCWCSGSAST